MRQLRFINADPICGWTYKIPETNFTVESYSFELLVDSVKRHYYVNNIDCPENISAVIQDNIASRIPESLSLEE